MLRITVSPRVFSKMVTPNDQVGYILLLPSYYAPLICGFFFFFQRGIEEVVNFRVLLHPLQRGQ